MKRRRVGKTGFSAAGVGASVLSAIVVQSAGFGTACAADETITSDSSADGSTTLQTITVTAEKRSEDLQKVPSTVTAVQGIDLQSAGPVSTKDIAAEVPGATAWNAENRARPRFFIRGIGSNEATNNAVQPIGIYYDEVYYLNSLYLGTPLFDLDRVEVLSGPQGTLWGKNTTGGAYNFVSKQPTFNYDGYAIAGVGSFDDRELEGAFGGPLAGDVLAQRVAVHWDRRSGLARNRLDGEEEGAIDDLAGRYLLLGNFTPDLTATLNLHVHRFIGDSSPTYAVTRPGVPAYDGYVAPYVTSGNRSVVDFGGFAEATRVDNGGVNLKIEDTLPFATLTSISSYDSGRRYTPVNDLANTPTVRGYSYGTNDAQQFSQELRLTSDPAERLSWITGLYYFHDNNHNYSASAALLPVSSTARGLTYSGYQQKTDSRAIFGSLTFKVNDRLALKGGLRFTSEEVGIDLNTYVSQQRVNGSVPFSSGNWWLGPQYADIPLQQVASQHERRTWGNLGYDFTPEFTIDDHQLAYARVATGYRSGNYAGGATLGSPTTIVNPEKLLAYEVGYKSTWWDDRVSLNASTYYYDYTDIQLTVNQVINGVFTSILANAGKGFVKGVELEARARITQDLTFHGNISDLRTRYTQLVTGGVSYAGYNFARVPNVTGLAALDYNVTLPKGQLKLSSDWAYSSKLNFNITNNTDPYTLQEGYWLGSVRAAYEFLDGRDSIGFYVNNVTNQVYKVQAMLYSNGYYPTRLGDPRTYGVQFTTHF